MVEFVPISSNEWISVSASLASVFVDELTTTGVDPSAARREFEGQLAAIAPAGVDTENQFMRWVEEDGVRVGRIWYGLLPGTNADFYVFEISVNLEHQRKGVAARTLEHTESMCTAAGAQRIGVHVFLANAAAVKLYDKLGYVVARSGGGRQERWKALV